MATKKKVKKKFVPRGKHLRDAEVYADFMRAFIEGTVKAVRLYESKKPNGDVELDFDEEVDA
jgi:hypothetical protein